MVGKANKLFVLKRGEEPLLIIYTALNFINPRLILHLFTQILLFNEMLVILFYSSLRWTDGRGAYR